MKVLLVGNDKFIAENLAQRFLLEGDKVFILGDLNRDDFDDRRIKVYNEDIASDGCNDIINVNLPDVIVYFDGCQRDYSLDMVLDEVNDHVNRFLNIFAFSSYHAVKKFIYISTTDLYNSSSVLMDEEDEVKADNLWENAHILCEQHILNMSLAGKISSLILRSSKVYGPNQQKHYSYISQYIDNIINQNDEGFVSSHKKTDYIYIEDFCNAVYKCSSSYANGIINIASGKCISQIDIKDVIDEILAGQDVKIASMDDSVEIFKAASVLDFVAYTELTEGIKNVVEYEKCNPNIIGSLSIFKKIKSFFKKIGEKKYEHSNKIKVLVFIEVLLMFAVVSYLTIYKDFTMLFGYIDIRVLYILIAGAMYGIRQSLLATFLSISLLVYDYLNNDYNLITLVYDVNIMSAIFVFLLAGILLGYLKDKSNLLIREYKSKEENTQKQLDHIKEMYYESLRVKDSLQGQIFNSENSYGRVFGIVSQLDSLDINRLKGEIIRVTEEIMGNKSIALYMFGRNKVFLRLASKSHGLNITKKSIAVEDSKEIQTMMKSKKIYINKEIDRKSGMLMAAPVLYENELIAIVAMYEADLESLTLSYQNLFSITMNLINQSIVRAYRYRTAQEDEWYIDGTNIMKPKYFEEILLQSYEMQEQGVSNFILVEVEGDNKEYYKLHVPSMIREFDYIGYDKNQRMRLLFTNTTEEEFAFVEKRFAEKNIVIRIVQMVV